MGFGGRMPRLALGLPLVRAGTGGRHG